MQWRWGNIGSALAGLSTLVIAVAALIRSPADLPDRRNRHGESSTPAPLRIGPDLRWSLSGSLQRSALRHPFGREAARDARIGAF